MSSAERLGPTQRLTFTEVVAAEIRAHMGRRRISQSELTRRVGASHTWATRRTRHPIEGNSVMAMRLLTAVVLAVALSAVPAASAAGVTGEGSYLAAEGPIQRSGFWGSYPGITDREILSIGYTACRFYGRGMSDVQVLREMVPWAPELATDSRAYQLGLQAARNAHRYLCP